MKTTEDGPWLDRFGTVLALIIATVAITAFQPDSSFWAGLILALQGMTLVITLYASGYQGLLVRGTAIFCGLVVIASLSGSALRLTEIDLLSSLFMILLAGIAPLAIGSRLVKQERVSGHTVTGALCIYLLVGLLFAVLYGTLDRAIPGEVLSGAVSDSATFVYFSFVTLTTLGYGDIAPIGDAARFIAVIEALVGQLYLVTVVALLVGNMGATRSKRSKS